MSTLALVMGLLALAYVGGLLGRGTVRGVGLPSGSEWIVLGFVLGPTLLGIIDRTVQADVEPVLDVAIGWVAFVVGLDYGVVRSRRVAPRRVLGGALLGGATVAAVGIVAWLLAPTVHPSLDWTDRLALALGLGAVASETTSNAVRWVAERHGAKGPLTEMLDDLAETKDLAPILAAGIGLCLHPRFTVAHEVWRIGALLPVGVMSVGFLLGLAAAVMVSREERAEQSWGIVVGIVLLATGTAARLRLPVVTPLFALGLAIGLASRHRDRLLALVEATRRSAAVPVLLLAGARVDARLLRWAGLLVGAVLLTRLVVLWLSGLVAARVVGAPRSAPLVGWAMLPSGDVTIVIALGFALTFPAGIGDVVLVTAVLSNLVGELLGPLALRAALRRAGELPAEAAS